MVQLPRKIVVLVLILAFTTKVANVNSQEDVNILFLMDHQFGANYEYIREIFEGYGWGITTASVDKEITHCIYGSDNLTVDLVVEQLADISNEYDCLSIMPGSAHTTLEESSTVIDMIKDVNAEGMLITTWCKAISVLIEADIIQGKNITGYSGFQDECEAAGATFNLQSPPIRDGNLITAVRSRFYRNETCELIRETVEEIKNGITSTSSVSGGNMLLPLVAMVIYITMRLKKK